MIINCPKCEKPIAGNLRAEVRDANLPMGYNYSSIKALIVSCPMCSTVLGTTIEPIALKTDIVNAIKKG
jgi:hypothetical protein